MRPTVGMAKVEGKQKSSRTRVADNGQRYLCRAKVEGKQGGGLDGRQAGDEHEFGIGYTSGG